MSGQRPPRTDGAWGGSTSYVPTPEEIPSGLCECGCGHATPISTETLIAKRRFIGYPLPRIRGHNRGARRPEDRRDRRWKNGGYVFVYRPEHPGAHQDGSIAEHRIVIEAVLGRILEPHERVHHRNGQKDDNRPENLELWKVTKKDPSGVRASDYHCAGCRCFD